MCVEGGAREKALVVLGLEIGYCKMTHCMRAAWRILIVIRKQTEVARGLLEMVTPGVFKRNVCPA